MTEQDPRYQRAMNQGHSAAWEQDWNKAGSHRQENMRADNGLCMPGPLLRFVIGHNLFLYVNNIISIKR